MLKGTYKDVFPKMLPARNWDPQRPSQPTIALPCPKLEGNNKAKLLVWPGMILSANPGAKTWTRGVTAADSTVANAPTIIAVAQDPTKGNQSMNVDLTDSLVGLPCTGNFRICTPFFVRGKAYTTGTALTYVTSKELEDLSEADKKNYSAYTKDGTLVLMQGAVRPAEAGETVIGYVVQSQDPKFYKTANYDDNSNSGINVLKWIDPTDHTKGQYSEEAFAMRKSIDEAVCSLAMSENSYFIEYDTAFQPSKPAAVVSK